MANNLFSHTIFFWKFHRDNLRKVLFDLSFPDPEIITDSNDLMELLRTKLKKDEQNVTEWLKNIYEDSIDLIPRCKFTLSKNILISKIQLIIGAN